MYIVMKVRISCINSTLHKKAHTFKVGRISDTGIRSYLPK